MRIETNLPNASNQIGGIYFAKVADGTPDEHAPALAEHKRNEPDDKRSNDWRWWNQRKQDLAAAVENPPPWLLSEEIDEKRASQLLGIPGFRSAGRSAEEIAAVDEALGSIRQGAAGVASGEKDRTIAELQAANQVMSAELVEEKRARQAAERQLAQSKLPPSERVKELEAEIANLNKTITELREMNVNLGKQASAATAAAAPVAPAAKALARRRRRRRRRAVSTSASPGSPAESVAARGA